MTRIILLGSGGHAKVVLEMLEENRELEIAGCTSPDSALRHIFDYPVLGNDSILPEVLNSGVRHAFVAVGENKLRLSLMNHVRSLGFSFVNAISSRAIVSRRVSLGAGVAVMPGAVINADAVIGDGAIVNTGATIDHDCRIGQAAHVAPGVNMAGNVSIGEGALLGIGSRVIPGVTVGPWAVVGAGSVVIRDVPAYVTAVGAPAVARAGSSSSSL